jgi:hypothetical protein
MHDLGHLQELFIYISDAGLPKVGAWSDKSRENKAHQEPVEVPGRLRTAAPDYHVPFGNVKKSNCAPLEQGAYAREFYGSVKTIYTAAWSIDQ